MKVNDFKLEHYFERREFTAPYLLSSSDAESMRLADLLDLADPEMLRAWESLRLGYTEVAGLPALREAIASLYEHVSPEEIVVFAGAQEPIFAAMNALLDPGDHVVVITPIYQSLYEVPRAIGANVVHLRLDETRGWALDLERLAAAVSTKTRLIVMNFPNSPTGALISRDEFQGVLEIAERVGARVFSDEVYRLLEFDPVVRLPAAVDLSEQALSLGVLSKSFGLAGLRIGWIATRSPEIRRALASFKHYLTICSSAPSEILATIALRAADQILGRTRDNIATNVAHLDRFFNDWEAVFSWVRPRAGTVGFPRLTGQSVEGFAEELLQAEGVLLVPGPIFDDDGNHFRIGFGRTNFPEGLERLERFVERELAPRTPAAGPLGDQIDG